MNAQDCEQLTLFPADSPVSHSVWLESKKAGTMNAIFGLKCSELSESLRRVGLSVRTYLESCELPPGTWSRVWSAKAITSACLLLRLRLSERRTGASASRLLPTVTATVGEKGGPNQRDSSGRPGLQAAAMSWRNNIENENGQPKMWKTPVAADGANRKFYRNSRGEPNLSGMVKMWPTPRAADSKGCGPAGSASAEHMRMKGQLSGAVLYPTPRAQSATGASNPPNRQGGADLQTVAGGQLNPTWVEWLMGYPLGWTDLNA